MDNIITPRNEIKIASKSELDMKRKLAMTEREVKALMKNLQQIDKHIKRYASEGREWFLFNPWEGDYLPYEGIYKDIITQLRLKGYTAERRRVKLSKQDLISIVIQENITVDIVDDEPIDFNEIDIKREIHRRSKDNINFLLLTILLITATIVMITSLFLNIGK